MKKRPGWITFIAWWQFLGAISTLILIKSLIQVIGGVGYITTIFSLLGFFTGYGLLRLKNWARIITIAGFCTYFLSIIISKNTTNIIIYGIVYGLLIRYLTIEKTRVLFKQSVSKKVLKKDKFTLSKTEKKNLLAKAYLGLGKVFEAKKDTWAAFDNYKKAVKKGASLHDNAILLVGDCYAQKNTKNDAAVAIYLKYIKLVPIQSDTGKKVYNILENICKIEETPKNSGRNKLIDLNRRVIDANPNLEWAYFYLGIGLALNGSFSDGVIHFRKALKLNPNRKLTYYWLGKCILQDSMVSERSMAVDEVFELFNKFLSYSLRNGSELKKQGEAAFELGKLLVSELGGFDTSSDLTQKKYQSKLNEAIVYFQKASDKDENNAEYLFYLGRTYALNQSSSEAIQTYENAIKLAPNEKEYFYYIAIEYWKLDKLAKAKNYLKKAIKIDSEYIDAIKLLANICLKTEAYEEVESHCIAVRRLNASDQENDSLLLQSLYYRGKFAEVIEEFEKLPTFILETDETQEVGFCIARSYAKMGNMKKAIELYRKLPENARNLYYLGCTLRKNGNDKEALSLFATVIDQATDFVIEALLQRGHVYFKLNKLKEAENDYLNTLEKSSHHGEITSSLGMVYFNTGNIKKAKTYFKKTLELDINHSLAHFGVGLISEREGDLKNAQREYESAINNGNPLPQFIKRLGIIYSKQEQHNKAVKLLEKVKESGDNEDSLLFYLGFSYASSYQLTKGLEVWQKLFERYPDDERLSINIARCHYLLGLKHLRESEYEKAISDWENYLKKYSSDDKTKKDIAQLYFRVGLNEFKNDKINLKNATISFERAVGLDESKSIYRFYLALCHMEMGDNGTSIKELEKLLRTDTGDNRFRYHFALALLKSGKKDKAVEIFNTILLDKNNDIYTNQAASIIANEHIIKNEYSKAISILEKAL